MWKQENDNSQVANDCIVFLICAHNWTDLHPTICIYVPHTHTRKICLRAHFFRFYCYFKGCGFENKIFNVLLKRNTWRFIVSFFFCCCKFFGRLFLTCYMYFVLLFSLDVGLYTYNYKEKLDLLLAIRCLYTSTMADDIYYSRN